MLLTDSVGDRIKAHSVLSRIEKNDLTTPWGVRTLSNLDPKYHPSLYHDGAVWPLVTGWAAISEIKMNRLEPALYYIESMAQRILSENGMYAETYRGDRPEPFNSCILQAWSVGMYVYAMQEMMLGMRLNMLENRIQFEPHIPESLRNNSLPVNFEHNIHTMQQPQRYRITVDPNREEISIIIHNREQIDKAPEIFSNSYSIKIEHS
jgi:glycogen debranching enzyme